MEALERWLIRETVRMEIDEFVRTDGQIKSGRTLIAKMFDNFRTFPPFRGDKSIEASLVDLFRLLPKIDRKFLMSFFTGPIISAARSRNKPPEEDMESQFGRNGAAEAAAALLSEVVEMENGVGLLLEDVKCAFSSKELSPSVQEFLNLLRNRLTDKFVHMVQSDLNKCQETFNQLPRRTIISVFRLHASDRVMSAFVSVLFLKPPLLSVKSIWQQLVASAMNQDAVEIELSRVVQVVPPGLLEVLQSHSSHLVEFLGGHVEEDRENIVEIAQRNKDSLARYLEQKFGITFTSESDKWACLRYVELVHKRAKISGVVDVLGSDAFKGCVKRLLVASKLTLSETLFAEGNGLVRLVEDLFDCVEHGLALAKAHKDDEGLLRREYSALVLRIEQSVLSTLHLLLINDKDLIVHDIVYWMFGMVERAFQLQLPTMEIVNSLDITEQQHIQREAELVAKRERTNYERAASLQSKLPPIHNLPHASKLLGLYRTKLEEELNCFHQLPAPDRNTNAAFFMNPVSQVIISSRMHLHESAMGTGISRDETMACLYNLDVTLGNDQGNACMLKRGFSTKGRTSSVCIWARVGMYNQARPSPSDRFATTTLTNPIVKIGLEFGSLALVDGRPRSSTRRSLTSLYRNKPEADQTENWTVIPRNLNKGVMGAPHVYLKFMRAEDASAQQVVRDVRFVDGSDEFNKTLGALGYRRIGSFHRNLLFETYVWVLGGRT